MCSTSLNSDPIMPTSGSFDMKLVKMGMSLGITINGNDVHIK